MSAAQPAPGPPAPPNCEVRATPQKGFGLYSLAPSAADVEIFPDEPLFHIQHTGNRRVVAACANCCAFIGSLQGQLETIFGEARFQPLLAAVGDSVRAWEAQLLSAQGSAPVVGVRCAQGCGEIYCSEACRDAHYRHSHNLLCTGLIQQEDHPLIQFKYHAIEHSDTILLAATVMSHLINRAKAAGGGAAAVQLLMKDLLAFCHAPFRDACRPPPGRGKDVEYYSHIDGLVTRAATLLHAALEVHAPVEAAALFEAGPAFLSEVLGMFEYNTIDVEVPSPLGSLFTARATALAAVVAATGGGEVAQDMQVLEKLLREKEWVMRCVWGEETTGIYAAEGDPDSGITDGDMTMGAVNGEVDAQGFNPMVASAAMDEARAVVDRMSLDELIQAPWPSQHGTALYASVARLNHSCAPNCKIVFPNNSARLSAVALKPVAAGEEINISYIRQEAEVKVRKQQLLEYGFVCSCERCVAEDSTGMRKATRRLK